jgi:putative FmdB family regulatory protein
VQDILAAGSSTLFDHRDCRVLQDVVPEVRKLPLYEYECQKDGVFERIQKFSDPPLAACPTCGGPIEKLASAPAIQFKGTGWYITDYARKSSGVEGGKEAKDKAAAKESSKESSKDSSSSSSSGSKGSTSDAKPASSGSGDKK